MTEKMRYLSRVKGEERQVFKVHRPRKAGIRYCIDSVRSESTYSIDIQGEGPGTGEPLSDAQEISILVVRALFRAPLVVVPRRRELVVNT